MNVATQLGYWDLPATTPTIPFNLCLVPDLDNRAGKAAHETVITLSHSLNSDRASYYEVEACPPFMSPRMSRPHCTVFHGLLPRAMREATRNALIQKIIPLVNEPITLAVGPVVAMEKRPLWDRLEKCTLGQERGTHPEGTIADALWLRVTPNPELQTLQRSVAKVFTDILGQDAALTPSGKDYTPHFTLWCRASGNLPKSLAYQSPAPIPCRVRLGDVGPLGQVRRISNCARAFFGG